MKKATEKKRIEGEAMRAEYDFREGVRGKHHNAYGKGHKVEVRQADGSATVQHFTLEEGAVLLAPDVREYFSDSDSVNLALRTLISMVPRKKRRTTAKSK